MQPEDSLIVTELSRLGRSTGEVIILINQLVAYGVTIYIIKQNLRLGEGVQDMTAKVMVMFLALFAKIERDFISLRTIRDKNAYRRGRLAMTDVHSLRPTLTVNRSFIREFITVDPPCFALGMIEERQQQYGLLALRLGQAIPDQVTDRGLNFGHSLLGNDSFEVIHFAFEFYGFQTYNVLVNPNNPLVQSVLAHLIENSNYFFFALDPNDRVTAFRGEISQDILVELQANLSRIQQSTTTHSQYKQALIRFADDPHPEGVLLNWICQDRVDYLNLTQDRMDLTPG